MTTAETQQLWREQNAYAKNSFQIWNKTWRDYYLKQGRILLNNLTDPGVIFPENEVSKLFSLMYVDVGTKFAESTYNSLTSKSMKIKRQPPGNFFGIWEQYMMQFAINQGGQSIVSISQTAKERATIIINDAVAESIEQGYGAQEAAKLIDERVWTEWKIVSKFNAERIARTEIIAAQNEGNFAAAQSMGRPLDKVWLAVLDGRERSSHADANGQRVDMNAPFIVGGVSMSKPGAKGAPAEEVINCRCRAVYVPKLVNAPAPMQRLY